MLIVAVSLVVGIAFGWCGHAWWIGKALGR